MPPKGRSLVGRSTSAARRMAASREVETPEQRQIRREEDRARQTASREAETPEQLRRQSRPELGPKTNVQDKRPPDQSRVGSRGRFDARKIEQDKLPLEKPRLQSRLGSGPTYKTSNLQISRDTRADTDPEGIPTHTPGSFQGSKLDILRR
jgi:hypothetical protein